MEGKSVTQTGFVYYLFYVLPAGLIDLVNLFLWVCCATVKSFYLSKAMLNIKSLGDRVNFEMMCYKNMIERCQFSMTKPEMLRRFTNNSPRLQANFHHVQFPCLMQQQHLEC